MDNSNRTTEQAGTTDRRTADRVENDPNPDERGKWISALIALLGVWMIVEAFLFDLAATQVWNDVIVGALLLAVGGYNYSRRSNERLASVGAAVIAAVLGLWLIAAPFMLGADVGFTETTNDLGFWNDIVVGLLALVLGAYSAYQARENRRDARQGTRRTVS